jgi:cytochrome c-type biogenesis protein CcmH/NrfF
LTLLWILPAALAVVGTVVIAAVASRAAEEASGLRRDLLRMGELRPALVELRDETRTLRLRRG